MPILQPIVNLVELLHQQGLRHVVVSPGSRSAPLTLAVARHPGLQVRVVPDERTAGFTALGMAQQLRQPVAIICTSGSAVYNLSPAVVEAYFQHVPLLLLTADRPHEWLYQQDGQTIDQVGLFGSHVKRSYDLPADYEHADARWFIERTINEAYTLSLSGAAGPVHVNVPVREPFYPKADETFRYERGRVITNLPTETTLPPTTWHALLNEWEATDRKLILAGQSPYDEALAGLLAKISTEQLIPVAGEILSNLGRNEAGFITQTDTLLAQIDEDVLEELRPDLLVTFGNGFLARNLKTYFRRYPAVRHWHISATDDRIIDPFRSLTTVIPMEPLAFFAKLFDDIDYKRFREGADDEDDGEFLSNWQGADQAARRVVELSLSNAPFTDWVATQQLLEQLPTGSHLHLANSMPVRYANLCGLDARQQVRVWSNRGVSGIDGCLSTAVGAATQTTSLVTVLIGDIAFFYDRNALWQRDLPANLRIVLLNNASGHIFRMIDGSGQQPELETYFETPHALTAERTCADHDVDYAQVADRASLAKALATFFAPATRPKLLEISTDKYVNKSAFAAYKQLVKS
ncbi:2-succinyl-6-hydroxy-2,4-cyclohexadiene-1-carboxylic acid synthase/2-oxoglutarate decarboxylase [Fibrella aestuarina BUZ 2]|uniref:2-succinyl-5-enolpyruvyl-6-hydroxy-3-cyclohexene-1-carboxylate synthase n=1 Tax=Fibrella aestuarina BUZ 2 TaxID=1166018 RepID=I0KAH9_9BACT|nr:2-succinyl-5-enolpyruvyl-6-hydroxy-3-cyclohexene-1-carboxylic-acid synthase [Fibrella aestuarina]CCH01132.1 2-succinyl-6-hydroxy-2,4-cyclohexadiene-1-carboxylic acid synthase/2-oxoglutarate decarboxylase [Fibrella aestuarina BUZ 2]